MQKGAFKDMLNMESVRRIVVKVGTSTLTHPNGKLNIRRIEHLVRCMSDLSNRGYEMVLVSSGAIAVGLNKMGITERPPELAAKQAVAAVGQCELIHIYDKMFLEYSVTVAQLLLTRHDILAGSRRDNIQNTFDALLSMHAIPIVNENDTVAVEEIEAFENFGDNDTLSAVVARLCHADLLVIFTDMDGLFNSDPRRNPQAKLIPLVTNVDNKLRRVAGGAGTAGGTGGMATKLSAAELCMDAGIPMIVANGERPQNLYDIVDNKPTGTLFDRRGASMK